MTGKYLDLRGATTSMPRRTRPAPSPEAPTAPESANNAAAGVHRFTIPNWRPATVNELLGSHWAKAGRLKKRDRRMVQYYGATIIPQAHSRRRVSLVMVGPWRGRTPDPDNVHKSLLDALVKVGLLLDDTQSKCEVGTVEFRRGKAFETTVILEDV